VGDKSRNFISHSLGRNDSNLTNNPFVDMEIKSQTRIILLDDNPCGLLNSFITYSLKIKHITQNEYTFILTHYHCQLKAQLIYFQLNLFIFTQKEGEFYFKEGDHQIGNKPEAGE
jgi:hypothetical protein